MSLLNKDFLDPKKKVLEILDEFFVGTIPPALQEQIDNNLINNLGLNKEV